MNTCDDRGAGDLDRHSVPETALSPGAHVVSPRTGYSHHGIYVGGGRVVHYRGFERGLRIGPVETASIEQFARGRPLALAIALAQLGRRGVGEHQTATSAPSSLV